MRGLTFFLIIIALAPRVFAGWVIKEITRSPGEEESVGTVYIQKNMYKTEDPGMAMICDLGDLTISFLDPHRKICWSGTLQELRGFLEGTLHQVKQAMEDAVKGMPSGEQKEAYKRELKNFEKGEIVEVKKTSETTTIVGYPCQKYQIWGGNDLKGEVWISSAITIKDEINFANFTQAMRTLVSGLGKAAEESYESSYIQLMERGYELRSIEYSPDGESTVIEVIEVKKEQIPASEFKIPKEFRQVIIEEFYQ